jgi:nucleotide-binding universal stress UspA family protein
MYKHILVTLDGSAASETALNEVQRLADGAAGVKVTLFSVAEEPSSTAGPLEPGRGAGPMAPGEVAAGREQKTFEDRGQAIDRVKDETQRYLSERAAALRQDGVDVDTEVAMGDPVEEILRAAGTGGVDLLVMATHGRTGLARVMFGSVASRVVSSGVKPVLLVRPATLA